MKKSNIKLTPERQFAKRLLELYDNKGMGFLVLGLFQKTRKHPKRLPKYMEALGREVESRKDIDKFKFTKELISAIGTTNGLGELHADSNNEAGEPEDADGSSQARTNDGSSRGEEESG